MTIFLNFGIPGLAVPDLLRPMYLLLNFSAMFEFLYDPHKEPKGYTVDLADAATSNGEGNADDSPYHSELQIKNSNVSVGFQIRNIFGRQLQ